MAPWPAARSWLAAAVLASSATMSASQAPPPPVPDVLQLSGACDSNNYLNSVYFDKQGYTLNGSPYFKARGIELYIYFDADCTGGGDGTPRWVMDNDRPSLGFWTDLDGDMSCEYKARINTADGYSPPYTGTWRMECGGVWEDHFLILLLISTTSTTTTTRTMTSSTVTGRTTTATRTTLTRSGTRTRSTTAATRMTTTATTVTTTGPPPRFVLSGACENRGFLNGRVFEEQGHTANGSPYFKSLSGEQYLYYDIDCDAGRDGSPRWILDSSRPAVDRFEDLDGDGKCDYHASLESDDAAQPPHRGTWRMFCGKGWVDLALDLSFDPQEVEKHLPATMDGSDHPTQAEETPNARSAATGPKMLRITGACQEQDDLNEVDFVQQGVTETGAPYYMSRYLVPEHYIYYDPACAGGLGDFEGRWVIDLDRPSLTRHDDLDGDRRCDFLASTVDASTSAVPAEATWRLRCGDAWQDVLLTITPVAVGRDTKVISAAPRRRWRLLDVALAAPLVMSLLL